MRSFEFKDDKSYKFWQIELAGDSYTVKWGRIGTKGQEKTKSCASPAAAQKEHDKLVAEKLKKGYVEATPSKAAPASPAQALENALIANPDDLGAHAAYADFLLEQGDPRGEFIQVQLALEDEKKSEAERKELKKREEQLLKSHWHDWLGGLTNRFSNSKDSRLHFARGWFDRIEIDELTVAVSRAIARAPLTRLLHSLNIESIAFDDEEDYGPESETEFDFEEIPPNTDSPGLYPLSQSSHLGNVRHFRFGTEYRGLNVDDEALVELLSRMPRLEELYLFVHGFYPEEVFALSTLRELRVLHIEHANDYPLEILAQNAALKNLTHILTHPRATSDDAPIRLEGVKALVRSPHLKRLTHLQIRLCDMGDAGCQEIVDSGILKRLKVLDLKHGAITDMGASILASCPDLANLELLDIDRNGLTSEGWDALNKVNIRKNMHDQQSEDELEDRYYLTEGDWE